jgi:hypothetical protein
LSNGPAPEKAKYLDAMKSPSDLVDEVDAEEV